MRSVYNIQDDSQEAQTGAGGVYGGHNPFWRSAWSSTSAPQLCYFGKQSPLRKKKKSCANDAHPVWCLENQPIHFKWYPRLTGNKNNV